jgi:polyisoprenoid-binding protein YceI
MGRESHHRNKREVFVRNNRLQKMIFYAYCGSLLLVCAANAQSSAPTRAQTRAIDVQQSALHVHVYKSGMFSAFGHEHEIAAPIAGGQVQEGPNAAVEFRVNAASLKVVDASLSEADRAKVQKTMESEVLDVARFPEIQFQSTKIEMKGKGRWEVQGQLALHGRTRPVTVNVIQFSEQYRGAVTIKQSDFGIAPVSVAGGTVKVKDDVRIDFALVLAR